MILYVHMCFFLTILNEICNLTWGEEVSKKKIIMEIFFGKHILYLIQLLFLWIWSYPAKIYLYRFYMYIYLFCFLFAYLLDLMALQIFLRKTFLSVLLVTTTTMDIHLQAISKSLLSLYIFFCHTFVKLLFFKYLSDSRTTRYFLQQPL